MDHTFNSRSSTVDICVSGSVLHVPALSADVIVHSPSRMTGVEIDTGRNPGQSRSQSPGRNPRGTVVDNVMMIHRRIVLIIAVHHAREDATRAGEGRFPESVNTPPVV